ncbi:MAG: type II toxin-antitoxin system YoeB family toxin [Deltaproteobacteria bacterium]|nr:type II toxin-antitoxin system YoeB family toxin [Deltaproteobacteria bacterium]
MKRINALLKDNDRNPYSGIGKPEPLKGDMSGWRSRRIDDFNRLICKMVSLSSCNAAVTIELNPSKTRQPMRDVFTRFMEACDPL